MGSIPSVRGTSSSRLSYALRICLEHAYTINQLFQQLADLPFSVPHRIPNDGAEY